MTPQTARDSGFTLVEMLIVLVIMGLLLAVGSPSLFEYMRNARLREAGNAALSEVILARNEAIKRNERVRVTIGGKSIAVSLVNSDEVISTRTLVDPVVASGPEQSIDFLSTGRPPLGSSLQIDFVHGSETCTSDLRCPSLRVDSGGAACIKMLNVTVTPDPCP